MDPNLQKYIAFLKAAQYKSFTRAAQALNYSQSGISRMIHDLEQEWHVQLFERKHGIADRYDSHRCLFQCCHALASRHDSRLSRRLSQYSI